MDRDSHDSRSDRSATEGFGDDQGTRVGAPDQEQVSPARHHDTPPPRPERTTGAGDEMQAGHSTPVKSHPTEHRSGYGGQGGQPVESPPDRTPEQ